MDFHVEVAERLEHQTIDQMVVGVITIRGSESVYEGLRMTAVSNHLMSLQVHTCNIHNVCCKICYLDKVHCNL